MIVRMRTLVLLLVLSVIASAAYASSSEAQNLNLNTSLNESINSRVQNIAVTVFETDFEKYNVGTTPPELKIYYNGKGNSYQVITTQEAHSGSKSFQVWGSPGWCSNVHYYFEKPEKGRIGYEVWVKANSKEEGVVQFVNPEGAQWTWGWCGVLFDQYGYIVASGGYKKVYAEDKWHKVRAEMDVETGACWVWIDDELVTDGITPAQDGKENPDAYKGIRGVTFVDCSWYENPSTPTYFDDFKFYVVPPYLAVDIDVKPGSCPNPINTKSKGVIPLAIVGTKELDVTTIDPKTILLSRDGIIDNVSPTRWNYDDVASPFKGEICDCHELSGDGYMDMILHFDTQALIAKLKLKDLIGGTIPLKITGKLKEANGGTPIEGQDCIKILK